MRPGEFTARALVVLVGVGLLGGLVGCESETKYGPCVGLGDKKTPGLTYKASVQNLVVGIIFSELIVPPIVVAVDEFYCPVAKESP